MEYNRYLIAYDFDHTIVDDNSDTWVQDVTDKNNFK